jgi:saccharopine dehydrogenase-like NADP-dependent oxidoreductase
MIDAMIRGGGPGADITAYVGVLPAQKTNRLGYGNIWGVDGLIAEYTHPAEAIVNGQAVTQPPLDGFETLTVNGHPFEAFTTSGSLGSLVHHYAGRIQRLQFKTLRFRGHLDYIRFLLDDLKLSKRLYMFRNLLLNGLDDIQDDQVILHLLDRDPQAPRRITHVFSAAPRPDGRLRSAVADVTALHVCAVVEALSEGLAPGKGVLHHHDLSLEVLTATRFGREFELSG